MKLDRQHPPEGTVRDWVDARAAAGGDAFVFSDGAAALDWPALQAGARAVAAALTALGVAKGESVAILQPNGREGVLVFFGAVYGGFRATMINLAAGQDAIG